MQTTSVDNGASNVSPGNPAFAQIWGNEMQREDFLALAAGLRQFNLLQSDSEFVGVPGVEPAAFAQE